MRPSTPLTWFFFALVGGVGLALLVATWRSGDAAAEPLAVRARWIALAAGALAVVTGTSIGLASVGVLRDFSTFPPPIMRLVAAVTVLSVVLATGPLGARLARGLPLAGLVAFQGFRVLVELVLFALHREGALPVQMTFEGLNFDVVSGLSALGLGAILWRGRFPRRGVLAWNVIGLALLVNIVVIAVLSMPTRLRVFAAEPPNVLVAEPPFVLLPTVLVQAALFAHILVFRRLRFDARRKAC
jgi:hypothetical protein